MDIVLHCSQGPAAGQTLTVSSTLELGREAPDPGRLSGDVRLSRRHARVYLDEAGRATIEDLGSSNGTFVNDERIAAPRPLVHGDQVRVGQTVLAVELPVAPAPVTVPATAVAAAPAPGPAAAPRLVVASGSHVGEEIPLGDELQIGRGFGTPGDLGGDMRLSRRHARIARGPGGVYYAQDTGSSNGTKINGEPLYRARALKDGDQIELGSTKLTAAGLPRVALAPELPPLAPAPGHAPPPPAPGYAPPPPAPGYAPPPPAYAPAAAPVYGASQFAPQGASSARLSSHRGRVIGVFAIVFAAAAAVAVAAVLLVAPPGTKGCPSTFVCQQPPTAPPLHAMTAFRGSLGWHMEYDASSMTPLKGSRHADQLILVESDSFDRDTLGTSPGSGIIAVVVHAWPTSQVSPQDAISKLASNAEGNLVSTSNAPNADELFGRPVLGFHVAQGKVVEGNVQTPQGPGGLLKVAVISAASGGVTVGVSVIYPVLRGQSDRVFDIFGDQILETIRFPDDGAV